MRVWGLTFLALTCACESRDLDGARPRDDRTISTGARSFSARETPIVFRSGVIDGAGELFVMAPDGSGRKRVVGDGDFFLPHWSPDGESLVFRQNVGSLHAEIGIITADGSPPVLLTQGEHPQSWRMPVHWLPSGEGLAYASWREPEEPLLWTLKRFGGTPERLLPDIPGSHEDVVFSKDTPARIAYTDFGEGELWMLPSLDATEPVNLTKGRVYNALFPAWSPDGTRIAFSGYAVSADGKVEGLGDHTKTGFTPPDGEIFVLDVASGELTRLTDNVFDDQQPTWSPDGTELLISSVRDGDADLWLLPVDAPDEAVNLIDDADAPLDELMPCWYGVPPG
jgi:Tol biopolymer transport system component